MAERQAGARASLCSILGVLWSFIRVHAMHPAGISLEAHYKERVVRKRDALRRTLHTGSATITIVTTPIAPSGGDSPSLS